MEAFDHDDNVLAAPQYLKAEEPEDNLVKTSVHKQAGAALGGGQFAAHSSFALRARLLLLLAAVAHTICPSSTTNGEGKDYQSKSRGEAAALQACSYRSAAMHS